MYMYLLNITVKVSRRPVPFLSFPLVLMHPEGMTVGALEFRVFINESLSVIVTCRDFFNAFERISEHSFIENYRLTGF